MGAPPAWPVYRAPGVSGAGLGLFAVIVANDVVEISREGRETIKGRFGGRAGGEEGRRLLALEAARGDADMTLAAEGLRLVNLRGDS